MEKTNEKTNEKANDMRNEANQPTADDASANRNARADSTDLPPRIGGGLESLAMAIPTPKPVADEALTLNLGARAMANQNKEKGSELIRRSKPDKVELRNSGSLRSPISAAARELIASNAADDKVKRTASALERQQTQKATVAEAKKVVEKEKAAGDEPSDVSDKESPASLSFVKWYRSKSDESIVCEMAAGKFVIRGGTVHQLKKINRADLDPIVVGQESETDVSA